MKKYFLFQTLPPRGSRGKAMVFRLWNFLFLLASGICLGMVLLLLAYGNYSSAIFWNYFKSPLILFLNVAPVVVLVFLMKLIVGRSWLAFLSACVISFAAAAVSYFKLLFRDDPLAWSDLTLVREAANIAGGYNIAIDKRLAFVLMCIAIGTVVMAVFARGRMSARERMAGFIGLTAAVLLGINLYSSDEIYSGMKFDPSLIIEQSPTQAYIARGFVYPFLNSISYTAAEPLTNKYLPVSDDGSVTDLSGLYDSADIPDDEKIDIIAIQLEAFTDMSKYNIAGLVGDPYAYYHELESESYTGNLITNTFAAGTIDAERGFLTGSWLVDTYSTQTDSFVWYLREQGYVTEGSHPGYQWFYSRSDINRYLGFENYYFYEDTYGEMAEGNLVAFDYLLLPKIIEFYEASKADNGAPYFSFNVTYQGHGPYNTDKCIWPTEYVEYGLYSDESTNILNNYLGSVADTQSFLKSFIDYFRDLSEPVVIVLYGDHNPWLGDGNSVYNELGINLDVSTQEGFLNYYGTRYLIWANDAAKQALGSDFTGEGPDISPFLLMNELFTLCGWDGPAPMQAARALKDYVPVVSTAGYYIENGQLTTALSTVARAAIDLYRSADAYYRAFFSYRGVH